MKVTKMLFIAVVAFAMTACSGSQSDSDKNDSAIQSQTETKMEEQVSATPEPETFVVNGKEVQLTKDVSTKADVIKALGEADMELDNSLCYNWHEGGKFIQYTFYFFGENGTFTKAEKSSMKSYSD